MKILLLNPYIDAWRNILQSWQARGDVVFVPENAKEAWQLVQLHGQSLDLAIVHREGGTNVPEAGLQFIAKLKADPEYTDLPVLLTSELWQDPQFVQHQRTPQGLHAYLHCTRTPDPNFKDKLFKTINAIFGIEDAAQPAQVAAAMSPEFSFGASGSTTSGSGPISVEIADNLYGTGSKISLSIELESPELGAGEIAPPPLDIPALPPTPVQEDAPALDALPAEALPAPALGELSIPEDSTANAIADAIAAAKAQNGNELNLDGLGQDEAPFTVDGDALGLSAAAPAPATPAAPSISLLSMMPEEPKIAPEAPEPQPMQGDAPSASFRDAEAEREMPYLFEKSTEHSSKDPESIFLGQPVGDAIVPGGAAESPDLETIKKYLQLREKDVAVLSTQLKSAREQVSALTDQVHQERARNTELSNELEDQRKIISELQKNKNSEIAGLQNEINELRFQMKAKADKAKLLEVQIQEASDETARLKDRVRSDIRKIRVREKELENKLEIIRKDSEVLIAARENKIMELKRKLDTLEFNMDLLQDRYSKEKENSAKLHERLAKAAQVVKVAGGFLDSSGNPIDLAPENSEDGQQEAS